MATKKTNTKSNSIKSNDPFFLKIRYLHAGGTISSPKFGTVKCTKSAKDSYRGEKLFSVSKSKKAVNRGNYTFGELCEAFCR